MVALVGSDHAVIAVATEVDTVIEVEDKDCSKDRGRIANAQRAPGHQKLHSGGYGVCLAKRGRKDRQQMIT